MKCKDCIHKKNIGNTEEKRSAICTFPQSYFPVNIDSECRYGYNCEKELSVIVDLTEKIKSILGDIVKKVSVAKTPNLKDRERFIDPLIKEEDDNIVISPYYENMISIEFINGSSMDVVASDYLWATFHKNTME